MLQSPSCQRFTVYVLALPAGRFYLGSTGKPFSERLKEQQAKYGKGIRVVGKIRWCTTRGTATAIEEKLGELRAKGKKVIRG